MTSLSDLVSPSTKEEILDSLLSLLAGGGFPIESWQSGGVAGTLLQAEAQAHADMTVVVAAIAKGGLVDLATGAWLTLLAASAYGLTRTPATYTSGTVVLTDDGAGPHVIAVGQLVARSADGKSYRNTTGGTLALDGTLSLTFKAETAGSAHNVPSGTITSLVTSLPSVTILNPADIVSGSWIVVQGADEESDADLRKRCKARWPELGTGATAAVYEKWARDASAEVKRVKVEENPVGFLFGGVVRVTVAGASGAVSGAAVTAIQDYIEPRRPLCIDVLVESATNKTITVNGTLTVKAAHQPDALARATAALTAYQATLGIGDIVYDAGIVEVLMSVEGAVDCALTSPGTDTALLSTEIPSFAIGTLTIVAV